MLYSITGSQQQLGLDYKMMNGCTVLIQFYWMIADSIWGPTVVDTGVDEDDKDDNTVCVRLKIEGLLHKIVFDILMNAR